jgi:pimeloyl-ACP methyl ester carboxylesterase
MSTVRTSGIDPSLGAGKLNWIPEEYDRYTLLQLDQNNPANANFKSACRYRLPIQYVQGVSTQADLKKVFFVVNGINNTWYHYELTRLLPDWLIICVDLRYNGYNSPDYPDVVPAAGIGDSNGWVGDIKYCYDDIAFCFDYFNIAYANTVVMYGHGVGGLVALGFYNTYKSVTDNPIGKFYKITQLILNSPYLQVPDQVSRALTSYLFNPLSYVLAADSTQLGILSKTYDTVSTAIGSGVPQVIAALALGSGASGAALASTATVAVKQLLNTGVGYIPSESTRELAATIAGVRDSLPYVSALAKSYHASDSTINPLPTPKTLIYAKTISDVQTTLATSAAFISCPVLAIFSSTIVSDSDILSVPGDNQFVDGTADAFIASLNKMSTKPITSYKFPNMFNDALASRDLARVSTVLYSVLLWLQSSGIVLNKDDGGVLDVTTVTATDVYNRLDSLLVKNTLVPNNTPFINPFSLAREAKLDALKKKPLL